MADKLSKYQKALDINFCKERIRQQLDKLNRHPTKILTIYETIFNKDEVSDRLRETLIKEQANES